MNKFKKTAGISPTFCVYPWMEFMLGPTSDIKLCCISDTLVKSQEGKTYKISEVTPEEYWNSYGLRQVRKKMLEGDKIPACKNCYHLESIGRLSYRQQSNREWLESKHSHDILDRVEKSRKNDGRVEKPPLYLDIRPGNLCNLKCRMCNPDNSSKIYQEQKELLKTHSREITDLIETDYFKKDEKEFHNWHKSKTTWNAVYKWLPEVKKLYFTGGEPTLIKQNWELIDWLKKKGYARISREIRKTASNRKF